MLAPSPAPSDADLIHRYREIEAFCSAEQAALDERMQPYKDGLKQIKDEMLRRLNERSPNLAEKANSKTEHGTAFRVRHVRAKVVDQNALIDWWLSEEAAPYLDLVVAKVSTEGFSDGKGTLYEFVEQHRDQQGNEQFPPGLEVERSVSINIRKS